MPYGVPGEAAALPGFEIDYAGSDFPGGKIALAVGLFSSDGIPLGVRAAAQYDLSTLPDNTYVLYLDSGGAVAIDTVAAVIAIDNALVLRVLAVCDVLAGAIVPSSVRDARRWANVSVKAAGIALVGVTSGGITTLGDGAGVGTFTSNITAIGTNAGNSATLSNFSVVVGENAGLSATATLMTAVGFSAGQSSIGAVVTFLGAQAGVSNNATLVVALGEASGAGNTGTRVVFAGDESGQANTGNDVVGLGFRALKNNAKNTVVAIGPDAQAPAVGVAQVGTAATFKAGRFAAPVLFAALPAAGAGDAMQAHITDSTLPFVGANIGAPAVGGGAFLSPVRTLGGVWVIG